MKMKGWEGSLSATIFIVFLSLAILFSSAAAVIGSSLRRFTASQSGIELKSRFTSLSATVIQSFIQIMNEGTESRAAIIEMQLNKELPEIIGNTTKIFTGENIMVYLKDLSSRLNLNLVPEHVLEHDEFLVYFSSSAALSELISLRKDIGLFDSDSEYQEFLREAEHNTGIGRYSYIHPDISDPFQSSRMLSRRLGRDSTAVLIENDLRERQHGGMLWSSDELRNFIELRAPEAGNLLTIEAWLNVNNTDDTVLETILKFPYGEQSIPQFVSAHAVIRAVRRRQNIGSELLRDILRLEEVLQTNPAAERVIRYLGTETWFWELRVEHHMISGRYVIARKIGSTDGSADENAEHSAEQGTRFQLIEQKLYPRGMN